MTKINSYRDLDVWKLGIDFTNLIYDLTDQFPKHEIFCLANQLRRSSISIPSNVAEGFGKYSRVDFKKYLRISLGSLNEARTQLLISYNRKYLSFDEYQKCELLAERISKMITSLLLK